MSCRQREEEEEEEQRQRRLQVTELHGSFTPGHFKNTTGNSNLLHLRNTSTILGQLWLKGEAAS